MDSGGSPAAHFCENGGVPVAGKKTEYRRIRMDSGHHRRIRLTAAVLGLLAFVPMALRLYDLMVVNYDYYAREALRNQTRTTYVTAMRGAIYDRNMNTLAASVGVENVYLDPHELKQSKADLSAIAAFLGELLDVDPESIEKKGKDLSKRAIRWWRHGWTGRPGPKFAAIFRKTTFPAFTWNPIPSAAIPWGPWPVR